MDKQVDPAVQERIRGLCKQITVTHDLDAEIQEELYGHMEDKLLAYLAGEEKLSPDDAFILVREHFGNPEALQEILQAVHEPGEDEDLVGVRVSLPRRLAAAVVATAAIGVAIGLAGRTAQVGLSLLASHFDVCGRNLPEAKFGAGIVLSLAYSVLICRLFARWQQRVRRGESPWFARWPVSWLQAAGAVSLIAPLLFPSVYIKMFHEGKPFLGWRIENVALLLTILFATEIIAGAAWLWWSDRPPRTSRGLEYAFLSLIGLNVFKSMVPQLVPGIALTACKITEIQVREPLVTGALVGSNWHWALTWPEASPTFGLHPSDDILLALQTHLFQFAQIIGLALLSYGVYILARRIQRWNANRSAQGQVVA